MSFDFSELEFLLEGIKTKNKNVELKAKYINFEFLINMVLSKLVEKI